MSQSSRSQSSQPTKVLVSGASGFIALHVVHLLLDKNYPVIGTVRSQDKADKLAAQFKDKFPEASLEFVIVPDIAAENAFDEVFQAHKDIKFVLHTASPFTYGHNEDNEKYYLKPAVNGTLNILRAVKAYAPQVTHVVVTSSFAAIINLQRRSDQTFIHSEQVWNPIEWEQAKGEQYSSYIASKKLAEKAAWDFVESEKPSFKLTTVNPPFVFGPQEFDGNATADTLNTSNEVINSLLKSSPSDDKVFNTPAALSVDVRDVALMHILPLQKPELAGKRLFPTSGKFSPQKILNIIHKHFPQLAGKIATGKPDAIEQYDELASAYNNDETKQLTGVEFIPLEKSVIDTVSQVLKAKA